MAAPPDGFLASPSADLRPLLRAAGLGDADAVKFFNEIFLANARCVLCDGPVGDEGTACVHPDPTAPGLTLLMPCCAKCAALPAKARRAAELALARAMWPNIR